MTFEVNDVGYGYTHNPMFRIERPSGSGDYLFLFFTTSIQILIDGMMTKIEPNSFIIYEPEQPQLYFNSDKGFVNDYFHFDGTDMGSLFMRLGIDMNKPCHIEDYHFIRFFIRKIEREYIRKDYLWDEKVSAQIQDFLISLARLNKYKEEYSVDPYKTTMIEKFKAAREEIFTNLAMNWNIDEMADLVYLSRSRFSVLYKEFFGCSPKEDLINARMTRAKYLLVSSTSSVKEIAERVGYDNIYHFSKQFKKTSGFSPRKYIELNQ